MNGAELKEQGRDLRARARETLEMLERKPVEEMLAKSRWGCDSHWMMAFVMTAGWETANKINLQVTHAVGKAEMHRLMKLAGIAKPRNDEEFSRLVLLAMEVFTTSDYWDYDTNYGDAGEMIATIRTCYAYTKVKSIGVEKDYQCGCFGLRAGWYEAMGVDAREDLLKCLKDGDPQCEILVKANWGDRLSAGKLA
jgi:hypothetical protein